MLKGSTAALPFLLLRDVFIIMSAFWPKSRVDVPPFLNLLILIFEYLVLLICILTLFRALSKLDPSTSPFGNTATPTTITSTTASQSETGQLHHRRSEIPRFFRRFLPALIPGDGVARHDHPGKKGGFVRRFGEGEERELVGAYEITRDEAPPAYF